MFMPPHLATRLTLPANITRREFEELTEGLSPDMLVSLDEGHSWCLLYILQKRLQTIIAQKAA